MLYGCVCVCVCVSDCVVCMCGSMCVIECVCVLVLCVCVQCAVNMYVSEINDKNECVQMRGK